MEIGRSASGNLMLGPPVRERIKQGTVAVLLFAVFGATFLQEQVIVSARLAVVAVLAAFVLFAALGVWFARNERYSFDSRKRLVEQNGRQLCRYDDARELLIRVHTEKFGLLYRLHLILRNGGSVAIGAKMREEDEANHAAGSIAAELGIGVRVER